MYTIVFRVVMFIIAPTVQEWIVPKPNVLGAVRVKFVVAKNKKIFFTFQTQLPIPNGRCRRIDRMRRCR